MFFPVLRFHGSQHNPKSHRACAEWSAMSGRSSGVVLLAAEKEEEFDDEDDNDGEFEDEAAGLIELVDHEAVEFAGGAKFLVDESAVVWHADFCGGQIVETG